MPSSVFTSPEKNTGAGSPLVPAATLAPAWNAWPRQSPRVRYLACWIGDAVAARRLLRVGFAGVWARAARLPRRLDEAHLGGVVRVGPHEAEVALLVEREVEVVEQVAVAHRRGARRTGRADVVVLVDAVRDPRLVERRVRGQRVGGDGDVRVPAALAGLHVVGRLRVRRRAVVQD